VLSVQANERTDIPLKRNTNMSRLNSIDPAVATGKTQELFEAVRTKLGLVPNMTRVMAVNPIVLESYLALAGTLAQGRLDPRVRTLIALTVAQANGCDYCLSVHTAVGGMQKLSADALTAARDGLSSEPRTRAVLALAQAIVNARGHISDGDLAAARQADLDDAEIAEIVAQVALNSFTNFFNSVADTEIDFPAVRAQSRLAA
jgi:uncharacterized peroxidase-related enzyme